MGETSDTDRQGRIQPRVFWDENHARFEVDDPMDGIRWLDMWRLPNALIWTVSTNIPGIGDQVRGNRSEVLVFFSAALGNEVTRLVLMNVPQI